MKIKDRIKRPYDKRTMELHYENKKPVFVRKYFRRKKGFISLKKFSDFLETEIRNSNFCKVINEEDDYYDIKYFEGKNLQQVIRDNEKINLKVVERIGKNLSKFQSIKPSRVKSHFQNERTFTIKELGGCFEDDFIKKRTQSFGLHYTHILRKISKEECLVFFDFDVWNFMINRDHLCIIDIPEDIIFGVREWDVASFIYSLYLEKIRSLILREIPVKRIFDAFMRGYNRKVNFNILESCIILRLLIKERSELYKEQRGFGHFLKRKFLEKLNNHYIKKLLREDSFLGVSFSQ